MKYVKNLFLLFAFLTSNVYAIDTYNPVNSQLTIPAVVLGNIVYKNVVITIGPILTVGGSSLDSKYPAKPSTTPDTYDPYKNQLTIPNVNAYGFVYYDVVINVGTVLSVESSSPLTPTLTSMGKFDMGALSEWAGVLTFETLAVGDVNMDGYDDILVGAFALDNTFTGINQKTKSVLFVYDPATNNFKPDSQFLSIVSKTVFPRQAVIADFDGDGRNDIYIGDHGVDQNPRCGAPNQIVLNKASGMVAANTPFKNLNDFSHGVVYADFNNDKKVDLLVLNSNNNCNEAGHIANSYFVSGQDFGTLNVNVEGLNLSPKTGAEFLVGVQDDKTMVLGGEKSMTIFEDNGNQDYRIKQVITPPQSFYTKYKCEYTNTNCSTPYTSIIFADLDNDGQKEIVASVTYSNWMISGGWSGQFFQVLKKEGTQWKDVSDQFFPVQNDSGLKPEWCYAISVADLNNDGTKDIVCSSRKTSPHTIFWVNKNGQFTPWDTTSLSSITQGYYHHRVLKTTTGHILTALKWKTDDPKSLELFGWKF